MNKNEKKNKLIQNHHFRKCHLKAHIFVKPMKKFTKIFVKTKNPNQVIDKPEMFLNHGKINEVLDRVTHVECVRQLNGLFSSIPQNIEELSVKINDVK